VEYSSLLHFFILLITVNLHSTRIKTRYWQRNVLVYVNKIPTSRIIAINISSNNNNNDNNNNVAPISSKWVGLSGMSSTGVRLNHSLGTMQNSLTNDQISKSEKMSFQIVTERNYTVWWRNMFREWIPKRKQNLKTHQSQHEF